MISLTCPFCGLACDDLAQETGAVDTRGCAKAAAGYARVTTGRPHQIAGRAASLADAAAAAGRILRDARLPVIAGLGADIAGVRGLLTLADRARAVIDYRHSAAALRNLAVLQSSGGIAASFSEVANRADFVLVVGSDPAVRYPRVYERLLRNAGALYRSGPPAIAYLGAAPRPSDRAVATAHLAPAGGLLDALAALRALVAGHKLRAAEAGGVAVASLIELAGRLAGARYGVIAWDAGSFAEAEGELAVETLAGIIRALNAKTRCVGLPLGGDENTQGAVQAMLWQAGWPARISFTGGTPRHDPWHNDARRLLAAGEADALLWVAALAPEPPPATAAPVIALVAADVPLAIPPAVAITVGCPGLDHGGAVTRADGLVTLPLRAARREGAPGGASPGDPPPSVAAAVAAILPHLAGGAP